MAVPEPDKSTTPAAPNSRLLAWVALNVAVSWGLYLAWDQASGFAAWQAYTVDAWTYLFPALDTLQGGAFDPGKRPFLYPLYLLVNFRAGIGTMGVVAQQLLMISLSAGLLAYPLAQCLRSPWRYPLVAAFVALVVFWPLLIVLAHYFASEAPYTLALSALAVFAWWLIRRFRARVSWPRLVIVTLATSLLCFLPLWLKSHWLLGAWVGWLALGGMLLLRLRRRPGAAAVAAALLLAGAAIGVALPSSLNNGTEKTHFGLRTVFCNHYPILRNHWHVMPSIGRFLEPSELVALDDELSTGYKIGQASLDSRTWPRIGYHGDWCLLRSRLLDELFEDRREQDAFFRANVRILLSRALPEYLGKIVAQESFAFLHPIRTVNALGGERLYRFTRRQLEGYGDWPQRLGLAHPGEGQGSRLLGESFSRSLWPRGVVSLLFLLAVARLVLGGLARLPWRRPWAWDRQEGDALTGFGGLLLAIYVLHTTLIAATHTFDIYRYLATTQPLVFGIIACGCTLLLGDVGRARTGLRARRAA